VSWRVSQGHLDDELWPTDQDLGHTHAAVTLEIDTYLPLLVQRPTH